ncbi:MAG TPA: NAD-dependent epimerase/dehydratase family protein [Bacteroidota bacterium]|nr:NAD-dependent epimerase/dehydratase family protein [Bacteroidota bacterium]
MNILLTGGAGFIGSNIADAYLEAGHNVVVVDDLSTGNIGNVNPRAKLSRLDIRSPEIENLFKETKFDVINHHAAQMDVRRSVADPKFDASVNVLGMLNVLEFGLKYGVKKVVFSSTGGAIYGEQDYFPADEQHPLRPLSPYGITKLATEKYLYYYQAVHGIQHVILRYANIYGPRQNPHGEAGVIAIFADKMLRGGTPVINGDGKQTRDYVYVSDVVKANLLALSPSSSGIFNIGTGIENDVNTLFRFIKKFSGAACEERHGEAKIGEQLRSVIDHSKAKKVLGWEPTVALEDGLKKTVEFFKEKLKKG